MAYVTGTELQFGRTRPLWTQNQSVTGNTVEHIISLVLAAQILLRSEVMNVAEIFTQVANKMRADVENARAAISHAGLKGGEFEKTFRTFLRQYLPASLDISTGQAVDSKGGVSKQLDVIIADAAKTPILYQADETRVMPIECVYAVIEVKATLTLHEVDSVFQNMLSVKRLQKTAHQPENSVIIRSVNMYGQDWPIWPVNYYVFAFEGAELMSVAQRLQELTVGSAASTHSRVDMVCILDRGVICNRTTDGSFDALPTPTSSLFVCNTEKSLLLFYTLASRYLNQTWLPSFRFTDYLGEMTFD